MQLKEQVEKSITKKYKKEIWLKFIGAIKEYELIKPNDKIAVCISGGKDSMLMAKCFQQLMRQTDFSFEVVYLVMDPGYNAVNRQKIEENAENLGIPLQIFQSEIFNVVAVTDRSPCYLCARMRRGFLYSKAKELGCNKIALGHHFDDVIETILMSMLYSAEIKTMMPKLHSTNFPGMELIRPMYHVKEADILNWRRYNDLSFIQCACRFTEKSTVREQDGGYKREEMKALIKKFRESNSHIEMNIFKSVHSVNLETVIGYRRGDERHSFLEEYEKKGAVTSEED